MSQTFGSALKEKEILAKFSFVRKRLVFNFFLFLGFFFVLFLVLGGLFWFLFSLG